MWRPTIRITTVVIIMITFSALFIFMTSGILEPKMPEPAPTANPTPTRAQPAPRPVDRTPPVAPAEHATPPVAQVGATEAAAPTGDAATAAQPSTSTFGRLHGTVRDASGNPVDGVEVVLDRDRHSLAVTSDGEGTFAFPDLPAGPYRIRAFHPDYEPYVLRARGRTVRVEASDETNVEIELRQGLRLEGVVIAADGSGPIGGAIVTLARHEYQRKLFVETGPDGRFRFDQFPRLPGGERPFPIEVTKPGFAPAYDKIEATANPITPIEIKLDRGTLVHGRIIDEFGQPVEGVTISCRFRYRFIKHKTALEGQTDNLGQYRIPNVPKGFVVQVWAEKQGFKRTYLNLIAGDHQTQKLMPPMRMHRTR